MRYPLPQQPPRGRRREVWARLRWAWLVLRHPATPPTVRWLAGAAAAYLIWPYDIVPDLVPVLGLVDEGVVIPLLLALAWHLVPGGVGRRCAERAGLAFYVSTPSSDRR